MSSPTADQAEDAAPATLASGKGHRDENFPVASWLIAKRYRPPIMAFYRFARAADDVADHPTAEPHEKLERLEEMRATLTGERDSQPEARALRAAQQQRGLSPQHGLDLLTAFRRDVTQNRYADWAELMDYCRYSAAPVGRFVLEVHGEDPAAWPANDALCTALQVINHLQDCAKDYRALDRVYVPEADLQAAGSRAEDIGAPQASPALRRVIADLARRTSALLDQSRSFAGQIKDMRLAMEVAVIQGLAEDLCRGLMRRDPLSQSVHHGRLRVATVSLSAAGALPASRWARRLSQAPKASAQ